MDGFVKVITDKHGTLIGASVVSQHAGEVIHELGLAIQYRLTAAQLANTLHAFPTWSEAIRVACAKIKL
jgi:dihydrolipoamide dehydrogenase